jgi:hypothetical protein
LSALDAPFAIRKPGFTPNPGSQVAFLACPIEEALIEGTRGGGKTDIVLMDFAQFVGIGYGVNWRGIIFRQSYKQLADLVAKSRRWFAQLFPGARFNGSDYVWNFPTGEQLFFRQMRVEADYWNYHGHEYPYIGFEELTNWSSIGCYDSMKACLRSSHPGMPRRYRSNANPWGAGHGWVKHYYVDPAPAGQVIQEEGKEPRVRLRSFVWENQPLLQADPRYVEKLKAIRNENKRRAWVGGDWSVVAGGILDNTWDEGIHIVVPFKVPRSWRIDRSFDWGSSKPFWCGWWAESDGTEFVDGRGVKRTVPRGTLFLIAEWYGWNGEPNVGVRMLATNVAKKIIEKEQLMDGSVWEKGHRVMPGPADSSIFDIENGNCISDDMAKAGCHWERADKSPGSRVQGWEKLNDLLENAVVGDDDPHFYVFETCRQWIRTTPTLPRSEVDPDDVETTAEDHPGDGTRYRIWNTVRDMHKLQIVGV